MNECKSSDKFDPISAQNTLNKWIIGETVAVKAEVDKCLEKFRFNEVANLLYAHVWGKFCDWYLEFSKPLLLGDDRDVKTETQRTFAWALDQCIIMLHPIMPFFTEEIWSKTGIRKNLIMHQDWPEYNLKALWNQEAHNEINWIISLVEEIRSVRAEMNVPAGLKISLQIFKVNPTEKKFLQANDIFIKQLARIERIDFSEEMQDGSISISVPGAEFIFPLANVIDVPKEKLRLEKTLQKLRSESEMLDKKLQNKKFLANAPIAIVEDIKIRFSTLFSEIEKKEGALSRLSQLK